MEKTLFKAVSFARKMIREKQNTPGWCIWKASDFYGVSENDVAVEVGKIAANTKLKRQRESEQA